LTAQFDTHCPNDGGLAFGPGEPVIQAVGSTCQTAVDGRRASKALAQWAEPFRLTEPDFQILWYLRASAGSCVDQTTLARQLAFSTAQVSASIEKLRAGGWILQAEAQRDRRRRLWQLSPSGNALLVQMLVAASEVILPASLLTADQTPSEAAA